MNDTKNIKVREKELKQIRKVLSPKKENFFRRIINFFLPKKRVKKSSSYQNKIDRKGILFYDYYLGNVPKYSLEEKYNSGEIYKKIFQYDNDISFFVYFDLKGQIVLSYIKDKIDGKINGQVTFFDKNDGNGVYKILKVRNDILLMYEEFTLEKYGAHKKISEIPYVDGLPNGMGYVIEDDKIYELSFLKGEITNVNSEDKSKGLEYFTKKGKRFNEVTISEFIKEDDTEYMSYLLNK